MLFSIRGENSPISVHWLLFAVPDLYPHAFFCPSTRRQHPYHLPPATFLSPPRRARPAGRKSSAPTATKKSNCPREHAPPGLPSLLVHLPPHPAPPTAHPPGVSNQAPRTTNIPIRVHSRALAVTPHTPRLPPPIPPAPATTNTAPRTTNREHSLAPLAVQTLPISVHSRALAVTPAHPRASHRPSPGVSPPTTYHLTPNTSPLPPAACIPSPLHYSTPCSFPSSSPFPPIRLRHWITPS
jgi:hypothetical protein